jgi:hypothetical protein
MATVNILFILVNSDMPSKACVAVRQAFNKFHVSTGWTAVGVT